MPGRRGWNGGNRDATSPPAPEPAGPTQQRAAARTVAAASTDLDDLRELLAMLGLDHLDTTAPPTTTVTDSAPLRKLD